MNAPSAHSGPSDASALQMDGPLHKRMDHMRSLVRIRVAVAALALISSAVSGAAIQKPTSSGDIYCSSSQRRFGVPGVCLKECRRTLANFIGCGFAPQCPAFNNDKELALAY